MKLTIKQLIQTICDLTDSNFEPKDIQHYTGFDDEKCLELSNIAKACISGEVEVEDNEIMDRVDKIYKYVEMACESSNNFIINSDNYDMGMFRAFYLVRERFEDGFPQLKKSN
jgi:hypothetical protein